MASEKCAGCFGTGKGVNGSSCTFCAGTGSIWVPDKVNYSSSTGYRKKNYNRGASWLDNAFEDNLAAIAMFAVWGIFVYYGLNTPDTKWYIPVILGLIAGFVVYKLLSGPLRLLGTLLKYLIYLGLLALFFYGIYIVISLFLGKS